ncbi:MAG: hypothetical protein SWE60_02545 [Thermodesulfobacteriota bacterium]|nr:hypothetical protein [Thermodesulfobacteriota bacterium]
MTTRFDINQYWIFKLEGHLMDGTALASQTEIPEDYDDENWTMFAVKTTFTF